MEKNLPKNYANIVAPFANVSFHAKLKEKFPIPKRPCWLRNQILWNWLTLLFSFLFFDRAWWRVWVKSLLSFPTSVSVYIMSISVSSYLLPFQKVKNCLRINSVPTIMVQFCCSSLYLGIDTVSCRLLLRMTTMDVDWNLKKLAQFFKF